MLADARLEGHVQCGVITGPGKALWVRVEDLPKFGETVKFWSRDIGKH
jgi:hypothetical protein